MAKCGHWVLRYQSGKRKSFYTTWWSSWHTPSDVMDLLCSWRCWCVDGGKDMNIPLVRPFHHQLLSVYFKYCLPFGKCWCTPLQFARKVPQAPVPTKEKCLNNMDTTVRNVYFEDTIFPCLTFSSQCDIIASKWPLVLCVLARILIKTIFKS